MGCVVVNVYKHPYDQYVGRAGKGKSGYWGNPYSKEQHGDKALDLFLRYFLARVGSDPEFRRRTLELDGKRLGCFCVREPWVTADRGPAVCHAQVIAKWVEENAGRDAR